MSLLLTSTLEKIKDYLNKDNTEGSVVDYQLPSDLRRLFDFSLGEAASDEELDEAVSKYIKYSVNTGNRQFLNQLFQGENLHAITGDLLAVATNASMYTYEVSPLGTLMEMELIKKMNTFTGFGKGDGTFSTGGSNSNLLAVLCAKHKALPQSKSKGLYGVPQHVMFVSEKAHYSFHKAAFTLGIGTENLVKVKTNDQHEIIPEELENAIQQAISEGKVPFFVAATTGTTELGAFDPVEQMATIAKKYNCWFHVDGSWGGSIIISEQHRHLFKGIEQADSFAWNAHKLLNVPLISAVFLVKDPSILHNALSSSSTEYIFHENDDDSCDLGVKSLQCGKRNDALKLWMAWKALGDKGFADKVDGLMDLAQYITEKIEQHPDLELLAPTQSLNINFRYVGQVAPEDLNDLNVSIREELWKSGKSMVNFCHLDDIISIRLVFANLDMTKNDVDRFLELFLETAHQLEQMKPSAYINQ